MPTIYVKIKAGSKSTSVIETKDMFGKTIYKVGVKSLPKDGEANEELLKLLSEYFDAPKTSIKIKSGQTSRNKVVTF